MSKIRFMQVFIVCFTLATMALGQSPDPPTIAILRFGGASEFTVTESTILDVLEAYGFINADERIELTGRVDLLGDNLNVLWGDGGWDLATINLMIEEALDGGADVLVALTTPVAQAVLQATADLDEPPLIIFGSVYNPQEAGIAQAPCLKPDHVIGSQIIPRYDDLLLLLSMQAPQASKIGTLFNSSEISGASGALQIAELGETQGLTVLQTAVTGLQDLPTAIEGLASRGIEALLLPIDSITANGMHSIAHLSYELRIPTLYPTVGAIFDGATFGVGFYSHFQQGINLGRLLVAYLKGEVDPAVTAIDTLSGRTLGVNLDAAALQGVTIVDHLRERADVLIEAGEQRMTETARALIVPPSLEELREAIPHDVEYIESLHCTDEMIAEQQAALEAAGG